MADWQGLAVCVGSTKTLAKLANHTAKKGLAGSAGVCDLTALSDNELTTLLDRIPIDETWGVGDKLTARLEAMGIHTIRQLWECDPKTIRSRVSVVLERTVMELRGVSCIDLEEVVPEKQQIMCSRSFGSLIYTHEELAEAVASYNLCNGAP